MFYRAEVAVCSETHTKHIKELGGYKVELLNDKSGGSNTL